MSKIRKRSVVLRRGDKKLRTSVSMEDEFWDEIVDIAGTSKVTISGLISMLENQRRERRAEGGLSGYLRLFVLDWYKRITETGKRRAA